jgi:hypothetical protein
VVARLQPADRPPLELLRERLLAAAAALGVECQAPAGLLPLLDFFRGLELWAGDRLLVPVVVLDQFEELFTLRGAESRVAFIADLGELLRAEGARPGPPLLKLVLSLREDFLGHLEELAPQVPKVLGVRYRLQALDREAARQAIQEPAGVEAEALTAPFSFAPAAVEKILDFLCRRRVGSGVVLTGEAEPFQLQLLCEHAERVAGDLARKGVNRPLDLADLGGEEGLARVVTSYYDATTDGHPEAEAVHALCERGLISGRGRRLTLEEGEVLDTFQVSRDTLAHLVDRRLLRAEPRLGSTYYELSHDTLVEPIRQARRRREDQRNKRRAKVAGVLAALLALAMFLVVRSDRYQLWRAVRDGNRLAAHGVEAAALQDWSRALAWAGRDDDARDAATRPVLSPEEKVQSLCELVGVTVGGARLDALRLLEDARSAAGDVEDPETRADLLMTVWSAAFDHPQLAARVANDAELLADRITDPYRRYGSRTSWFAKMSVMVRERDPERGRQALEKARREAVDAARHDPEGALDVLYDLRELKRTADQRAATADPVVVALVAIWREAAEETGLLLLKTPRIKESGERLTAKARWLVGNPRGAREGLRAVARARRSGRGIGDDGRSDDLLELAQIAADLGHEPEAKSLWREAWGSARGLSDRPRRTEQLVRLVQVARNRRWNNVPLASVLSDTLASAAETGVLEEKEKVLGRVPSGLILVEDAAPATDLWQSWSERVRGLPSRSSRLRVLLDAVDSLSSDAVGGQLGGAAFEKEKEYLGEAFKEAVALRQERGSPSPTQPNETDTLAETLVEKLGKSGRWDDAVALGMVDSPEDRLRSRLAEARIDAARASAASGDESAAREHLEQGERIVYMSAETMCERRQDLALVWAHIGDTRRALAAGWRCGEPTEQLGVMSHIVFALARKVHGAHATHIEAAHRRMPEEGR